MKSLPTPMRVFLDSGVILEGCYSNWGASKGVLILAAQRRRDIWIVLAEAVEREVRRDLALTTLALPPDKAMVILEGFDGWLRRIHTDAIHCRLKKKSLPTTSRLCQYCGMKMMSRLLLLHCWPSQIGCFRPTRSIGIQNLERVLDYVLLHRNNFWNISIFSRGS